jgi:hypothetical protein
VGAKGILSYKLHCNLAGEVGFDAALDVYSGKFLLFELWIF